MFWIKSSAVSLLWNIWISWHALLFWVQGNNSVKLLYLLQKTSSEIPIQSLNSNTGPLFKDFTILKSLDKTAIENCILLGNIQRGYYHLSSIADSKCQYSNTRWANLDYFKICSCQTKTYSKQSIIMSAIYVCNCLQSCHQNVIFHQLRANKLKQINFNSCN